MQIQHLNLKVIWTSIEPFFRILCLFWGSKWPNFERKLSDVQTKQHFWFLFWIWIAGIELQIWTFWNILTAGNFQSPWNLGNFGIFPDFKNLWMKALVCLFIAKTLGKPFYFVLTISHSLIVQIYSINPYILNLLSKLYQSKSEFHLWTPL